MYKIAIVDSSPAERWHCNQLMDEVQKVASGALIDPIEFSAFIESGKVVLRARDELVTNYDAFILRGLNEDGLPDYQLEIFKILQYQVPLVVNPIDSILLAWDKFRTTWELARAGLAVPRSAVTQVLDEAIAVVNSIGKTVVKPLYGSLGEGIELVTPGDSLSDQLAELLKRHKAVYLQEYIETGGRDIRAFVVGDEVVAAMYRLARPGEWITNIYQGAKGQAVELPAETKDLCIRAAKTTGLFYTGVDIIESEKGPLILEVNGTPSWMGISAATGVNIAARIVGFIVKQLDLLTGQDQARA